MCDRHKQLQGRLASIGFLKAGIVLFTWSVFSLLASPAFGQDTEVESPEIFSEAKTAIAQGDLVKSHMHGLLKIQKSFSDCSRNGAVLTGFDLGLARGGKNPDVIIALRPIYRTEKGEVYFQEFGLFKDKNLPNKKVLKSKVTLVAQLKAKPGYAVGAIHLHAGKGIHALSLTYMRITGTNLDPRQSYTSHWYGNPNFGRGITLGGNGAPFVGLFGNQNEQQVLGLGVFQMKPPVIATNPLAASWPACSPPPYSLLFRAGNEGEKTSILLPVQPPEEFSETASRIDRPNELPKEITASLDPVGRCKFPPPPPPPVVENTVAEEEIPSNTAPPPVEEAGSDLSWLPLVIFVLVITIPAVIFFLKNSKEKKEPEIPQPKRPDTDTLLSSALGAFVNPTSPIQTAANASSVLSTAISQAPGQQAPPANSQVK